MEAGGFERAGLRATVEWPYEDGLRQQYPKPV
jgi:hypothetical protein